MQDPQMLTARDPYSFLTALPKAGAVLELPLVFNRAAEGVRGSSFTRGFFFF